MSRLPAFKPQRPSGWNPRDLGRWHSRSGPSPAVAAGEWRAGLPAAAVGGTASSGPPRPVPTEDSAPAPAFLTESGTDQAFWWGLARAQSTKAPFHVSGTRREQRAIPDPPGPAEWTHPTVWRQTAGHPSQVHRDEGKQASAPSGQGKGVLTRVLVHWATPGTPSLHQPISAWKCAFSPEALPRGFRWAPGESSVL